MKLSLLAVLIWSALCSAAGATPTPWHRTIAYTLMAVFPFIAYRLNQDFGWWAPILFLALALFQLRLLFIHWLKLWIHRWKGAKYD